MWLLSIDPPNTKNNAKNTTDKAAPIIIKASKYNMHHTNWGRKRINGEAKWSEVVWDMV